MYRTGDVVCASYGDFNGDKRVGIFVVLYSEKQDRTYSGTHSNYVCAKITTNNLIGDGYTVRLNKGEANLENDCLVNVSKFHTFTSNQIYKLLGRLSQRSAMLIFKEHRKFNQELEEQMLELF